MQINSRTRTRAPVRTPSSRQAWKKLRRKEMDGGDGDIEESPLLSVVLYKKLDANSALTNGTGNHPRRDMPQQFFCSRCRLPMQHSFVVPWPSVLLPYSINQFSCPVGTFAPFFSDSSLLWKFITPLSDSCAPHVAFPTAWESIFARKLGHFGRLGSRQIRLVSTNRVHRACIFNSSASFIWLELLHLRLSRFCHLARRSGFTQRKLG